MRNRLMMAALCAAGICTFASADEAQASSHREAPFVTKNPKVDSTDFYMFESYEAGREGYVTLIANYLPLQDAYGGPNYFSLDPEALYEIHIDNNGDGGEDFTFQFEFDNTLNGNATNGLTLPITLKDSMNNNSTKTNAVPLMNIGPITAGNSASQHVLETYTLTMVKGDRRTGVSTKIGGTFKKPLDNVGSATFSDYETYAKSFVSEFDMPGCTPPSGTKPKVFVGQRAESFAANIGVIFDLVQGPNNQTFFDAITSGATGKQSNVYDIGLLYGKNVTSIAIEVPISCVKATSSIIGGWTSASMRQARVLNPNATYALPAKEGGAWTQVSRLGMPLTNEVVIGLKDKDKFSSSAPKGDSQFADYVTHPTLPALLEVLYGTNGYVAPKRVRTDLVGVFATGLKVKNAADNSDINYNQTSSTVIAEYQRLNTGFATAQPIPGRDNQNRLGVLGCFTADRKVDLTLASDPKNGCDLHGFPNGRRPGDDTVDIALRVVSGALFDNDTDAPARNVPITDLNYNGPEQFDDAFPYLTRPAPGNGIDN